jgi:UDP-N-acetylmuramyl pentapeptide synthase
MTAVMEGRPIGTLPEGITGISIDSRSIGAGEAFFAIKGDRVDGHDYASIAVANGASLIVVSEGKLPALGRLTVPMIVVEDVLVALGKLAVAARARSRAREGNAAPGACSLGQGACGRCVLQQSLGCAADTCPHAGRCRLRCL